MFKHCPRCRDEFVQHVETCPDCRVPLVTADALEALPAAVDAGAGERVVAIESAVALRRGQAAELRPLCELLEARGIPFVVDAHPRGNAVRAPKRGETLDVQLAIYVDESNAALAAQLEREWIFASVPGARDEVTFGPADGCPGCGEPLAASATACASCGLEFPPLEIACPRCGRPVAVEAESCGECGFRP